MRLFEFGVFGLGGDEDGDVGVGLFPLGEEVLIGGTGFGSVALHGVSAGQAEMGKRARGAIPQQPAMVQYFLEFDGSGCSLLRAQLSLGADVNGIQTGVGSSIT